MDRQARQARETRGNGLRVAAVLKVLLGAAFLISALAAALGVASSAAASGAPRGPVPPPAPPAFGWITGTAELREPTPSTPPPPLPDLSVQWIERQPRYARFCVDYQRGVPELCPGTEDDQRFPNPGEVVTFTARLANQGPLASPAFAARWQVDGQITGWTTLPPLAAGATATLSLAWPWETGVHTATLALDPGVTIQELSRSNNVLHHRTDALYLDVAVHPLVETAFRQRPNLVGSWSFADWMQAQVAALNENLAASAYPSAPHGALDRARIDRIVVSELLGSDLVTSTLEFDGRWTFRVEPDDPDTPEDEAAISAENYAANYAGQVDWGLIHELAHQLGVIDLYQLNVVGSYQNELAGEDGRPLLMGFQWPNPGLMGGGDRGDHPWYRFSEHTVLALNQNRGLRRGYFGEYLFDLPDQTALRVLDNRSQPLAGARVLAYQTQQGVVRQAPVFAGVTDQTGRLAAASRPVPFGGLTTATGHTLRPNPFGNIDVVGQNGQLLLQISHGLQATYLWWPITDFNLARWHGAANQERTVATSLAPPDAPQPPALLDGALHGETVSLSWPASNDPSVVSYRVYRGDEPAYYPFQLLAAVAAPAFDDVRPGSARYAVTALDASGRESGFSPIFRAPRLWLPAAVVVEPGSGQRTVLDQHEGALITQLADQRWVGRQGSVHLGLTGSEGLAANQHGQLLAAGASSDLLTVLDQASLERVNWFGRERFVDGMLDGPVGAVQAGPRFSVAEGPAIADGETLGLASFDDDISLSGSQPLTASGVTVAPGRFGSAVRVNGQDQLLYDAAGRLETDAGSVQLWVRPEWVWNDDREHVFVEIGAPQPGGAPEGYRLRLAKADWNGLYAWIDDGTSGVTLYADIQNWQPGDMHHLAVAWQPAQPGATYRRYTLWIDGRLHESQVLRRPAAGPATRIAVGCGLDGGDQADAVLDDLHISAAARVGNSQQTRLVVSQRDGHRIDVFDWLGNRLSSLGGPGAALGEFQSPQGLAILGDTVWVADRGNGRIQRLRLADAALTALEAWEDGLSQPHSLAVLDDGRLLVSDVGDQRVRLLDTAGVVRRTWRAPNDGQSGQFSFPAGIALTSEGDAVIADRDNGRVVRLLAPGARLASYLPLVQLSR